eukprot:32825_1
MSSPNTNQTSFTMSGSKQHLLHGLKSTMNDSYQMTLHNLLHRGAKVQPNSEIVTALRNGTTFRITTLELKNKSTQLASALDSFGIKPGDVVGSFMWANWRHCMLYQALPLMGSVLHTLNIRLHPNELSYLINHANDKIIFIDSDLIPIFEKIPYEQLQKVQLFIVCNDIGSVNYYKPPANIPLSKWMDFDMFIAIYSDKNPHYKYPDNLSEDSGALLVYTSGTTGKPKGVLSSHRSIYIWILQQLGIDVHGISGSSCILPLVPMFHAFGWTQQLIQMTIGNKIVLIGNVNNWKQICDLCLIEKCDTIFGVPTVLQMFRTGLRSNPLKYKSLKGVLKRAVCAGASPSTDLIKWYWNNYDIIWSQTWGMTECMFGMYSKPMTRRLDINKSMEQQIMDNSTNEGLLIPGCQYKIVNPDNMNQEIKHDGKEMGELLICGPGITCSYFGVNAKDKFHNGWLKTGDIATITADEIIKIRDRSKDVIKSGGEWISSVDMENFAMSLDEIDTAVVLGVKSKLYDERPILIVVLNNECSLEKIMNHLRKKYASFQLPDDILVWKEIPVEGTGKISKKKLRDKLQDDKYVLPDPPLRKILKPIQSKL